MSRDENDKTPIEQAVEQAVDAFVYAPIGLLFDGPALFPKLVEKGKNQVQVARMMGKMAVQVGQTEAEKRAGKAQAQVRDALEGLGVVPRSPGAARASDEAAAPSPADRPPAGTEQDARKPAATRKTTKKPAATKKTAKKSPAKKKTAKKTPAKKTTAKKIPAGSTSGSSNVPAVESLEIPDYDSLSASQVVSRLRGLGGSELDAVKAYESATRARKTILNKITQLQKG